MKVKQLIMKVFIHHLYFLLLLSVCLCFLLYSKWDPASLNLSNRKQEMKAEMFQRIQNTKERGFCMGTGTFSESITSRSCCSFLEVLLSTLLNTWSSSFTWNKFPHFNQSVENPGFTFKNSFMDLLYLHAGDESVWFGFKWKRQQH